MSVRFGNYRLIAYGQFILVFKGVQAQAVLNSVHLSALGNSIRPISEFCKDLSP